MVYGVSQNYDNSLAQSLNRIFGNTNTTGYSNSSASIFSRMGNTQPQNTNQYNYLGIPAGYNMVQRYGQNNNQAIQSQFLDSMPAIASLKNFFFNQAGFQPQQQNPNLNYGVTSNNDALQTSLLDSMPIMASLKAMFANQGTAQQQIPAQTPNYNGYGQSNFMNYQTQQAPNPANYPDFSPLVVSEADQQKTFLRNWQGYSDINNDSKISDSEVVMDDSFHELENAAWQIKNPNLSRELVQSLGQITSTYAQGINSGNPADCDEITEQYNEQILEWSLLVSELTEQFNPNANLDLETPLAKMMNAADNISLEKQQSDLKQQYFSAISQPDADFSKLKGKYLQEMQKLIQNH